MRVALLLLAFLAAPVFARREPTLCGTTAETANERLFLHRQAVRKGMRPRAVASPSANRDTGNIAIIEDTDGIVARQNEFNLDLKTLSFTPSASRYTYAVTDGGYDPAAASAGALLGALDDDDSRLVPLPFTFPFFGVGYREVYVNSDGNLTFTVADHASADRSLGRMTAGPPRIAPLFDDLNPAQTAGGVRVLSEASRVVVSWVAVPEWVASGSGSRQTFQAKLYPDGRIEFSYNGLTPSSAVVGIAPGRLKGPTSLVDYRNDQSATYSGPIAERFGSTLDIDIVTAAQRFYQTHEDAYDYLVIFNNMDVPALKADVIAYESTVRSRGTGYGLDARDDGAQYGSASRLQAVLNMGPLSQYPADPNGIVPARAQAGDTPLTTLAHETGHLFLAYASVGDPNDPSALPMLGYQNQHWSFLCNSEASLLEGERIADNGPTVSPRFITTATVEGYSPLDQYLMGLRPPAEVPDTFYVTGPPSIMQGWHPARGVSFDGARQNVAVGDVIQAMGRRTPDETLAQRRYRFAFLLIAPPGQEPSAADLATLETYRAQFETFFAKATSNRASAETSLRRALKLSLFPAAGVIEGGSGTATLSVDTAPAIDTRVTLQTANGNARFPVSVTLPAGATTVSFTYSGVRAGVEDVTAAVADPGYETAFARVQVAGAGQLTLVQIADDPIVVRLSDANGLLYSGARIIASSSAGGTVSPAAVVTDAEGLAAFRWTPGVASTNQLVLAVENLPAVSLTLRAGLAVPVVRDVVNSASNVRGFAAGALETIYGANLLGARITLNGAALPVLFGSDTQMNFYAPAETPLGTATLTVTAPSGEQASRSVRVTAIDPGIFSAAVNGDTLEIFCTGLNSSVTPVVFLGAAPLQPASVDLISPGLYRVRVRIPAGVASGPQTVLLSVNLLHSNTVQIVVN
jgi:hypothetical protein